MPLLYHTAVERGGRIHVVGGSTDGRNVVDFHYVHDPAVGGWQQFASLPEDRRFHGAGLLSGQLCVFGGTPASDRDWCYDDLTDQWTEFAPLAEYRSQISYGTVNGTIYAIGGGPSRLVHSYTREP